jgi:hypothetical protein
MARTNGTAAAIEQSVCTPTENTERDIHVEKNEENGASERKSDERYRTFSANANPSATNAAYKTPFSAISANVQVP